VRVGVFGGVFNPPHIGHLICAQEAWWQLELDRLVWMPVREAPHREVAMDPGLDARYELCLLAIAGDERFSVSCIELEREGPSYTVDTLNELRQGAPEDELFLILGGDEAAALGSWHRPEEVLSLATVAVAERQETRREHVVAALANLGGGVTFFTMPRIDVSSSMVRERVASERPIRYLVPEGIAEYIERAGLYGVVKESAP
jgi:nicotinate-nucleotide adenylyltransferase